MRPLPTLLLALLLFLPAWSGCRPWIPPEDLGTVLDEAPDFPAEQRQSEPPEPAPMPTHPEADSPPAARQ
jgi:hypothetical protein